VLPLTEKEDQAVLSNALYPVRTKFPVEFTAILEFRKYTPLVISCTAVGVVQVVTSVDVEYTTTPPGFVTIITVNTPALLTASDHRLPIPVVLMTAGKYQLAPSNEVEYMG
jgi:hypothetical protein